MKNLHKVAGTLAFLIIITFLTSTLIAEISGNREWIMKVKTGILWGLLLLVPSLIATGGSGNLLGRTLGGRLINQKRTRMTVIAANGILILVPAAIILWNLSRKGSFGMVFIGVQTLEILAGLINIYLIALNIRDGIKLRSSN